MNHKNLTELLSCPISWELLCPEQEMLEWLYFGWYATCVRYQVDREVSSNFSYENFAVSETRLIELDGEELAIAILNVQSWIELARKDYQTFFRRFSEIVAVGSKVYAKHYSNQYISSATVSDKTFNRGASLLLPYISTNLQERLMWAALGQVTACEMADLDNLERYCNPSEAEKGRVRIFV